MKQLSDILSVRIIIPTLNEEGSIQLVLEEIMDHIPEALITVIDGQSTDRTRERVREMGIPILVQKGKGKGSAIAQAISSTPIDDDDIVIMLDGDYTYSAKDAVGLADTLSGNGFDIVAGSRLHGKREKGSITPINLIGNRILSRFASLIYGYPAKDVCTGLWVFKGSALHKLPIGNGHGNGFDLEATLFAYAVKHGLSIGWVPSSYRKRRHDQTKLSPVDGIKILYSLAGHAGSNNHQKYN